MIKKDKLKILMVQLPVPGFTLVEVWGNIPLAAGYLSSMSYKKDLIDRVDIEILDMVNSNLNADARMIDVIVSKSPDILCFSLYAWNSLRTLFIAQKIKKRSPHMKIIVGGPEVTKTDTRYIMNNSSIDIGCIGEGEFTFVEIIQSIFSGRSNFKNINGIFYRDNSKIIITPPRTPTRNLDDIPSPYILGILDPSYYGNMWIEMKRGCSRKCTYCSERLRSQVIFSTKRVCTELKIAVDKKVGIFFIESSLVSSPNFKKIFQYLKKINWNRKIPYMLGDACAEDLSEEIVDLLKGAGVNKIEVGLQSTNPDTLCKIRRPLNLQKFLEGINLLKKREIDVSVDIIIGLPEDTLEDFKATLSFLKEKNLKPIVYILKLEPGTEIRKEAARYRIKYQNKPPYRILEAPYISSEEIKEAIAISSKAMALGKDIPSFPGTLVGYSAYNVSQLQKDSDFEYPEETGILNECINKIIIDIGSSSKSLRRLRSAGIKVSRMVSQPLTVWFKTESIIKDFELIKAFSSPIAADNPFLLWNIILETSRGFPISMIKKIKENICSKEDPSDFYQSPHTICAIFPWRNNKIKKQWLAVLSKIIPFYWFIEFSEKNDWQLEIEKLFEETYNKGFLIDFSWSCDIDFIIKASKFLFKKEFQDKNKSVVFKNYVLNQTIPILKGERAKKAKGDGVQKICESILVFDKNLNISSLSCSRGEATLDSMGWLMKLKKVFKNNRELNKVEKIILKEINYSLNLGSYYEQIKEYNKALQLYKKLLRFSTDNGAIHLALSRIYSNLRQYEDAIQAANRVIELNYKEGNVYFLLGFCYERTKQYKMAIEELKRAEKISPKEPQVNLSLSNCYRNIGQIEQANKELDKGFLKLKKSQKISIS